MQGQPLIDAHHIGLGETGNETWSRNVLRVLEADKGSPVDYVVTEASRGLIDVPTDRLHEVSGSSTWRILQQLPRMLQTLHSSAVLTQYTLPLTRVPGVVVIHDLSYVLPEAKAWIPGKTLLRLRATIGVSARRSKVVIAPTDYTREQLISHYKLDPDKVLLAPLALDPELAARFVPVERTGREVRRVLCVGTVVPRKNLPVAALAVKQLRGEGYDVRLRVVGPVREAGAADVATMTELLGDALELVGAVSEEQLAREYTDADIVAYPSLHEGFGLPLLEAMSAGTPVVTSNATCLPEVAGDGAILVDPHDDHAWAQAFRHLLNDRLWAEALVDRGHLRVEAFSWERTGAVVREALEKAVG